MAVIGYIRVSTEQQNVQGQKYLLLEYAQKNKLFIDEFLEIEISSRRNLAERRITELQEKLNEGDILLVAELSRLGRNMLETLQIIKELGDKGVEIIFVRQPELSTTGIHSKLLLAIYSYFAEAERDFLSMRTKQGMAAIRASGKHVGRPKGSKNKKRQELDAVKSTIEEYLQMNFSIRTITELLNSKRTKKFSFDAVRYYVRQEFKQKKENPKKKE